MKKFYFLIITLCVVSVAKAQIINFPDANFKAKLLESSPSVMIAQGAVAGVNIKIDANNDGEIQIDEALVVTYLNVNNSNITSLSGIENFTNIVELSFDGNPILNFDLQSLVNLNKLYVQSCGLNSLDISNLPGLEQLYCSGNNLTSLNLGSSTSLGLVWCAENDLTTIDISSLPNLLFLKCGDNQLNSIVFNTQLRELSCENNNLTSLNVSGLTNLEELYCTNNQITELDLSTHAALEFVFCEINSIETLDLSSAVNLMGLKCDGNNLSNLFIKNGSHPYYVDFNYNPNLSYICCSESQLNYIQSKINTYGYSNCSVSTYCSFIPGGVYYTVQGNVKFDYNNDGCNTSDLDLFNLRFRIGNGSSSGGYFSNNLGNYSIPLQSGSHTVTPIFENPTYFTISPPNVWMSFPTQPSPFTQNFCVAANGTHSDLEVVLLSTEPARPGFDTDYKLIFKNKGTHTQSGTLNLSFDDTVLDLVSALPVVTNQTTNNLSWDFVNLQPFEIREIALTLNVNSPLETPAVNGGDILNYTATITSAAVEETPEDNTFVLDQTVVNSYDPNDKTCLEGTTIAPSEVGKYVHYVIRFENTGTYPAENIVVKDMIDTAKFDVNSIVPIKGSHDFYTRINGNKVEFIFENINLPFDDANNDGYVAFKIKTKPTLVNGDTFSNSASIYFDYNFPIITNTATTTIQALSTQDFEFGQYFKLYPNPVNNVLNIDTKQTIAVSSISIYNQLGQLVVVVPSAQNVKAVDVSNLSSGSYFVKVNSDKGTSNAKFIKR